MAKKLDFWLVVKVRLNSTTEKRKLHTCAMHVYRDLTKSTSRSSLEIAIFKKSLQLIVIVIFTVHKIIALNSYI